MPDEGLAAPERAGPIVVRTVDLTAGEPPEEFVRAVASPIRVRDIPVEQQRESMRGILAGVLVALFALIVIGSVAAVIAGRSPDAVKSILEVALPPIVALTGTAVGFYFGGQGSSGRGGAEPPRAG